MFNQKIKDFVLVLILFSGLLVIDSCKDAGDELTPSDPIVPGDNAELDVPIIVPSGNEPYLNFSSDYVFDQNELRTYELILLDDSLNYLNNDPAAEQYVEGMLVFEGDTISPVGI